VSTPHDRWFRARTEVRAVIARLVQEAGAQMTARPVIRSEPDGPGTPEPEPLAGITAAVAAERAARQCCLESVRYAREDGLGWEQVGAALGFTGQGAGSRAYAYACPGGSWGDWLSWTCPACRAIVRDHGPEAGSPADAEQGHADGCARLAATIAARDARWEDEG